MKSSIPLYFRWLVVLILTLPTAAFATEPEPVVLQVGEQSITLSQFNHQFEMAMVLSAIREGVPNKSGVLIRDLKERFLKSRARDLLLKQHAGAGVEVSRAEEDVVLADLIQQYSDQYDREGPVLRQEMETLRDWIHEDLLLQKIRHTLMQNATAGDTSAGQSTYLDRLLEDMARQTPVRSWPERLD